MTRHRPSLLRRMNRLRSLMMHAFELSQPMIYFFDHLARDPVFLQQSVPGNPELDDVLDAVGRYVLGLPEPLSMRRFFRNGELWHGCCAFGATPATVLYHGGVDIGLLAVPLADQHATVRFTRVPYLYLAVAHPAD
jgi:hypothetical protein